MYGYLILGLVSSLWLTWLTIGISRRHCFGVDEVAGVQKFHSHWVPRLGGIPIFVSFISTLLLAAWMLDTHVDSTTRLLVCVLPAFGIGLIEDVTRKAGVLSRLLMTMVAAAIGWWLLEGQLDRIDIPGVDSLLAGAGFLSFALTLIAAGGVAHAVNIIDGYNGLSGFFACLAFAGLAAVALQVGDEFVFRAAAVGAVSMLGFLAWNFPFGRIFLGDAGAYFAGFLLAELSILLVHRNPGVSAWCPMLLMIYPVWETLFSILRRSGGGLRRIGQPDALHLHQLVYRRLIKRYVGSKNPDHMILRNSLTSVYLWVLVILSIVPAVLFYDNRAVLTFLCACFALSYLLIYGRIVRFQVPRWIVAKPMADGVASASEAEKETAES